MRRHGPGLVHPLALLAIAVLVLNDHWAKQACPGELTGKLSDIAGLVFFPLLLQAFVELPRWLGGASRPRAGILAACVIATGAVFSAINLHPVAEHAYEVGLGYLQWLPGAILSTVVGTAPPPPHLVDLTRDPTDLLALPALWLAWRIGRPRD